MTTPGASKTGHLGTHPSATYAEGENGVYQNSVSDFFGDRFADGVAAKMSAVGDVIEWTFTTEYDFPVERGGRGAAAGLLRVDASGLRGGRRRDDRSDGQRGHRLQRVQ